MQDIWTKLLGLIKKSIPESSYKIWIEPLKFGGIDKDKIIIKVQNEFTLNWIRENYLWILSEKLSEITKEYKIQLIAEENPQIKQNYLPSFSPEELIRPKLIKKFTFEEFVVGESNRFAYQACRALANGTDDICDIIYLHASTGMGKSHLTHAVGNSIFSTNPNKKICYTSVNEFTNSICNAIKEGQLESFKKKFLDECDVLLLEELHMISGRSRTQKELASTLDMILRERKKVVFTSTKLPQEIPKLDKEFSSRIVSGLIITINPPDYDTRKKIIQRKAKNLGLNLTEEIVTYLSERLTGDIRKIEGAITGIYTRFSLLNQEINMKTINDILKNIITEPKELTIKKIKETICNHFQIDVNELSSKSRKKNVSLARQLAMYFSRKFTKESLETIGYEFNRDHATVIHSIRQIDKQINESNKIKLVVEHIRKELEKKRWENNE